MNFSRDLFESQPFAGQLALDHNLRRNARMIGARKPQRVVAAHAMPADGAIDFRVLEHVPDVQGPGHVRRRNDERKHGRIAARGGLENAVIDPPLRPMRLKPLRLIDFLELHGEFSI